MTDPTQVAEWCRREAQSAIECGISEDGWPLAQAADTIDRLVQEAATPQPIFSAGSFVRAVEGLADAWGAECGKCRRGQPWGRAGVRIQCSLHAKIMSPSDFCIDWAPYEGPEAS